MKRYLFLLFAIGSAGATSVTAASDPSPGMEQVSITKQLGVINPPVIEFAITAAPELPYVAVIEHEAINVVTDVKPSPKVEKALLNSGSTPVVSADRSVWLQSKQLYFLRIPGIGFNYIEGRATEYRC